MSATENHIEPARADKSYDVVVIGSGAGGATLAQRLAATDKSVLILERGAYLPRPGLRALVDAGPRH